MRNNAIPYPYLFRKPMTESLTLTGPQGPWVTSKIYMDRFKPLKFSLHTFYVLSVEVRLPANPPMLSASGVILVGTVEFPVGCRQQDFVTESDVFLFVTLYWLYLAAAAVDKGGGDGQKEGG